MSWSIIKKAVNSDLNEPLNYSLWIDDLATFGVNGYVYNNIGMITELVMNSENVLTHNLTRITLLNGLIANNTHVGLYFKHVIKSTNSVFDSLATMATVAASTTAMNAVAASTIAMNALIASATGFTTAAASTTAMNAIFASTTGRNIVIASTTAMNSVASSAIAMLSAFNSTPTRNAMWDSASASNTLMTTGRAWMVANRQLTFSMTFSSTGSAWLPTSISGRIFVLGRFSSITWGNFDDDTNYRALPTGLAVGTFRTSNLWEERSDRITALEVWRRMPSSSANIQLRYIVM